MIESEAIEIVRKEKAYMDSHAGRAQSEAFQTAINALEKQITKKPTKDKYVPELDFCPMCGTEVTNCNYCPLCGQKIDQGELE